HPDLCLRAQAVASKLMVELCGAKLVPGTIDVAAPVGGPPPPRLALRAARVGGLLGMEITQAEQTTYLERLGFGVEPAGEDLTVTVPPDRHYDVTREVDLIEEVARVHGIDEHLPTTLPAVPSAGGLSREQRLRRRAEDGLRDLGFDQVVGWSFTDPGEAARLRIPAEDPRADPVALSNPLSEEQSAMRTTVLGSLLDVAARNVARGADRLALFEAGAVYLRADPPGEGSALGGNFRGEQAAPVTEPHRYAALAVGPLVARSWRGAAEPADFFALKGVLEALAAQLGAALEFAPGEQPFLHPGRSATVSIGGVGAGWLGEIHPLVCREWDLDAAVGFEVDAAALLTTATAGEETYEEITEFPAVRQDLAVVVPSTVAATEVRATVLAAGGELLRSAEVFDLYAGDQVGAHRVSLALSLEFRAPDRTLTDEEVGERRAAIKASLEKIGGALRE
ncbi:MAG TPA: phenylalanine--tRNA ligase subunit beta, partial [Solirubrobacterales bacterium]|nr:phenylalanine--tRNA ligase subunit beta [Solirubrobacterales bacterium]